MSKQIDRGAKRYEIQLLQLQDSDGWKWRVIRHEPDCGLNCLAVCVLLGDGLCSTERAAHAAARARCGKDASS